MPTENSRRKNFPQLAAWLRQAVLDFKEKTYRPFNHYVMLFGDAAEYITELETRRAWKPITNDKPKGMVLVAHIMGGKVWRVSEAAHNGLGWYDVAGKACHWATHWCAVPAVPVEEEKKA